MSLSEKSRYVHCVSQPKKDGINGASYFRFQLQAGATDLDFAHGICYDNTKRNQFDEFQKWRSPVTMKNISEKRWRICQVDCHVNGSFTDPTQPLKQQ